MGVKYLPFVLLLLAMSISFYFLFDYSEEELAPGVCTDIMMNGGINEKINILYLPDDYASVATFEDAVTKFNEGFFTIEPYASLKNEFNIYRLDSFGNDLGCTKEGTVICSQGKVNRVGKQCPHDFIVVLSQYSETEDLINPLRSASIFNLAYVNGADSFLVLSHESGHMVGDLVDEYLIPGGDVPRDAANCAQECREFDILDDCKQGCITSEYYRSIDVGLMRNYWDTQNFGIFNERELTRIIKEKGGSSGGVLLSPKRDKVYIVDFSVNGEALSLSSISGEEGYAPKFNKKGYSYVLTEENKVIEKRFFGYPTLIMERGNSGGMNGEYKTVEDFSLVVPTADFIEVFNEMGESLGEFGLDVDWVFRSGQKITFDVDSVYRKLYLYDSYHTLKGKITLDCKDLCKGEFIENLPTVSDGEYILYYYTITQGWKKQPITIGTTSSTEKLVLS